MISSHPDLIPTSEHPRTWLVNSIASRRGQVQSRPWPDHPIPVLLVITDLDVGGAERALTELATRLDRSRWRPSVACLGPEGRLAETLRAASIDVVCLDARTSRPFQALRRLRLVIECTRPALIQSFLFHANLAVRLAAPLRNRPCVLNSLRVAEHGRRWHLWLDRLTQSLACGAVCVSDGVRAFSIKQARINPDRLVVIPNGINPDPYDRATPTPRATLGIPPGALFALFVGRLERQKGVDILLDAADRLAGETAPIAVALAGDGPLLPTLQARLNARVRTNPTLHILGRRNDIPSLLKACDLLVLPSRWEGMPNVVLEAMAASRPVVATRVEGTSDLVVHGETGWLVAPNEPEPLANALRDALHNPDERSRRGRTGRARVDANFRIEHTVQAFERLWAEMLGFTPLPAAPDLVRPVVSS